MDKAYSAPWVFIIDTNQYAGNFEREMCAHCTGEIGECGVGVEYAEAFQNEFSDPIFDTIEWVGDDHGCFRPVSLWTSPTGGVCNSVAIFFNSKPTKRQIELMKERAHKFSEVDDDISWRQKNFHAIKVLGFRLLNQKVETTDHSELVQ